AVVEDGFVAFNTESCTVYVLDAKTGKLAWQEWLGDPLMSQPAIYKGKLYIAYPAGQRGHHAPFLNKVNANNAGSAGSHNQKIAIKDDPNKRHRMLCADLKTGKHLWEQPITADVISAPVIHDNKVFFTCQDGTSFCMAADSGTKVWEKAHAGTSAPVIADGRVLVTEKEQRDNNLFEGIQIVDSRDGKRAEKAPIWQRSAPYLNNLSGAANGTIAPEAAMSLDSAVGFGGGAPAAAAMDKAASNLNINTVAAGWAYQGPRLALKGSTAFNAQGQTIQSFSLARGGDEWVESSPSRALPQLNWEAQVKGKNVRSDIQVFSPPSLGRKNMYLASQSGHLVALDQKTGELSFSYATGSPVVMQPSLAGGNVYVGTSDGMLICLKTGNPDADGWTAWGGNAQHNKQD
ncbi:MAG TPA: PQQ-binding-like beta-propeller repeat protein, partial [Candidatus Obscuribacterales bacterium]